VIHERIKNQNLPLAQDLTLFKANNLLQNIRAWLLPRICAGCGFESESFEFDLCANCKANLPWIADRCYQCGLRLSKPTEAVICEKCESSPPAFNRVCALFAYKPPISRLIGALKFGKQLYPGALFGKLLTEAITQDWYKNQALPQAIIPVPLHIKRHRNRGYNQAAEISLPIAKALKIPLRLDICDRVKHTAMQARLKKNRRTRNLAAAFAVKPGISYKHVAIVDDVVTTGSTVNAVARVLLQAGVECIDVWCVCRG
jgi:ComF family protein